MRCNNCYVPSNMLFSNVYIREVIKEEIISVSDTLKGDSAYEVAVKLGYKGNEEEWLSEQGATIEQINVNTGEAGTEASVVLNGTPKNRIIDLTIPKGDRGIQGEKGDKGDRGISGRDGSYVQKAYKTYASMVADIDSIPINTNVVVNNDPDKSKNAYYTYDGSEFTKSDFDPQGILTTVDVRLNQAVESASDYFQSQVADTIATSIDSSTVAYTEAINTTKELVVADAKATTKSVLDTAVTDLFGNGGLPATPFETKALMTASLLEDGKYAMVTNDADNNGLYVKSGGVWVKSDYDPLAQSQEYTDAEVTLSKSYTDALADNIRQKIGTDTTEVAVSIVDTMGSALVTINSDASVDIVGLDSDIAKSINDNKATIDFTKNELSITFERDDSTNALNVIDSVGNVLAKIDDEARLHLVGLDTDVVSAINNKSEAGLDLEPKDTSNLANYSYKDTFEPAVQSLLNFSHYQDVGLVAPAPLGIFKQNFTINDTWLDDAVLSVMPEYIPIDTPYGNNRGVVHPHLLEFPNGFAGYKYIIAITGYTNGNTREENPFVIASNDLVSFDLITGLLDEPDGYTWENGIQYNSDTVGFYDPKTLEYCICWRRFRADTSGSSPKGKDETLYIIRTKDLVNWSEKEIIFYNDYTDLTYEALSPAIIYDAKDDLWRMYMPDGRRVKDSIRLFTSKTLKLGSWTNEGYITGMPVGAQPWHLDAKYIGDKIVLCSQERGSASVGLGSRIGISTDGINFTWATQYWDDVPERYECYKSTFIPEFNDQNQMRLVYMWTSNSKYHSTNMSYKLFVAKTPFFNAGVTIK